MAEAARVQASESTPALVGVAGVVLEAFPDGVLWWADQRLLVVADLHLEKGSAFARRGQLIPPYDTTATLTRLSRVVTRLAPRIVVSLGDSFHDNDGATRLSRRDRAALASIQSGRDWIWIAGNHDPALPRDLAGSHLDQLAVGPVRFVHEPLPGAPAGEIAGHLHPAARVAGNGRSVRRRCFAGDGERLVMPAFGTYAGGLNIMDRAFAGLFALQTLRAFMLGDDRVYPVGSRALRPD
ncbi:ligase-associated DNA damage response endonuclease PdeM [Bauldia sp.]|uniref:ligase-associated DNA damage response endonuclease PdeM n=1 Tax=Bauldia sp. TaxID=2575872 RepID=UPI003BAAA0CA